MKSLIFFTLLAFSLPAYAVDIQSLGKPIDNDIKEMSDRLVYFNDDATDVTVPIDRAILAASDIEEWLRVTITDSLDLNAKNYEQKIILNKRYFTTEGYAEYINSLNAASLPTLLQEQNYRLSAVVLDRPEITEQGLRDITPKPPEGAPQPVNVVPIYQYVWQVKIPTTLSYTRDQEILTYKINVESEVVRIPVREDGTKIALHVWRFVPIVEEKKEEKNLLPEVGKQIQQTKSGSRFAF